MHEFTLSRDFRNSLLYIVNGLGFLNLSWLIGLSETELHLAESYINEIYNRGAKFFATFSSTHRNPVLKLLYFCYYKVNSM